MAKEFAKPDGTPIPIVSIDVKAYGDRTFMRGYRKEDHSVTRDDGNIIQEVKTACAKELDAIFYTDESVIVKNMQMLFEEVEKAKANDPFRKIFGSKIKFNF